ncbi:hypothetical protein PAPHI01_2264 [Pancytospora philotis]|nr:hypothetical protein PAPHI01_2264 [Pancytospora philotis]
MEQSDSPKARRFVPLADFYTLRHAICAEADYNSLSGDLKLKWMALVFSRLTLSLYALRDVFSGILELGPNDAKAPEDIAEALHSFFVEAHGSESGTIAEPMYELFDHFDLFELAYAGCIRNTNAPLYLIEDYGAWTYKREIKEHLDAHARSFITSMLALSKAWQISRDGKITKQALESAAEEINNFNRENDECS